MINKKIIIAGGTGFIGQLLAAQFGKENRIVIISRHGRKTKDNSYSDRLLTVADGYNITYWHWDGRQVEKHWAAELEGADLLINLAGKSVNCRYTEQNKQTILDSRVNSNRVLAEAIRQCSTPPALWINAASATIYRHATDRPQDEFTGEISDWKKDNMPYSALDRLRFTGKKWAARFRHGKDSEAYQQLDRDFSVQVCKAWEQSFLDEPTPGTRKVALRIAITLGAGSILVPFQRLARLGLGGSLGNGRQMMSWVHAEDLGRVIHWCLVNPSAEGVYNVASPGPVSNKQFMSTFRKLVKIPFGLPAPACMLELGAALIGTETELLLKSRWVLPARLEKEGFVFRHSTLEPTLKELLAAM
ncbi:MAG: DUF1731 domain-containing protein [Candidatus Pseudobacter hemicellulosilyticus]|uniref:DUF1731 domain-containing protein n=1 Tax=Candidatus Pseudobacter hemicellulosilyticus TaxID=3121375 RepID=A0AAJ5WW10_9BACT|nr:MAG: DUF1731 domain-containing protein [Pseudobacter sp.]